MVNIENYIIQLTDLLQDRFGSRLLYVGLQGSYLRGEATEDSDVDIMVVVDGLSVSDLDAYRMAIESLPSVDKSCGFICSLEDLKNWNPLEIGHLLHTTKDYYGVLQDLVPEYSLADVQNFVKLSVNNLYHEICHRYLHADKERRAEALPGTYKSVFFILQNAHYLRSGHFAATKMELLPLLEGNDRAVLERCIGYAQGKKFDFAESFRLLFCWCQETIQNI
jgi:hypothetical protein